MTHPPQTLNEYLVSAEVHIICAKDLAHKPDVAYGYLEHAKRALEQAMYQCWHTNHTSGKVGK